MSEVVFYNVRIMVFFKFFTLLPNIQTAIFPKEEVTKVGITESVLVNNIAYARTTFIKVSPNSNFILMLDTEKRQDILVQYSRHKFTKEFLCFFHIRSIIDSNAKLRIKCLNMRYRIKKNGLQLVLNELQTIILIVELLNCKTPNSYILHR